MFRNRYLWPAFALATVLFYFTPLFSSSASIHWDLADVSYPAQKYFEQSLRGGKLPHWTPFLNSGDPFLSDPATGAWYPLHWPFFLIGITPRALAWELALHAFLALSGTFLLARRLFGRPEAALAGAMFYAWSGYFAARSSQLAKFEAAALLPWLLWATLKAIETNSPRFVGIAGLIGGLIALTGDLPSAVFSLVALVLFIAALRRGWKTGIIVVACAALLSAIVVVPAAQLLREAAPAEIPNFPLTFKGLAAIFSADYWGAISGLYKGPEDMRQFYLYAGLLLAPMAVAGIARREKLWLVGSLVLPPLAFAFIPGTRLPRAVSPMDFWFVAALGLALAAASGSVFVTEQVKRPYLWILLVVLVAADLWHWNMYKNPLVYARAGYEDVYGKAQQRFEQSLLPIKQRPFYRLWSSTQTAGLGPLDGSLLSRTEVSYGSGLATLNRYQSYLETVRQNPLLLNDLAITHGIDTQRGTIVENPAPLGRATVATHVAFVPTREAAHEALKQLDPSSSAIIEASPRTLSESGSDSGAPARITDYHEDSYRIQTEAPAEFLLKLAVPYHEGWKASIDGRPTQVFPVNEALMGAFVPAGSHDITFQFAAAGFHLAAAISLLGLLLCAAFITFPSVFGPLVR